ncbi:uncharacterized protein CLUP02_15019 [Colletotrichum lupini]|uniref:Uncharacterized protein n=1 Tax=Colletotrichum lupini TaxID=145971 RepID=A0A9Q8T5A6_9PEZI|nr:uncharacterized protein CLUP02_15019 [Colletotrichum lupini]UQC89488.1 hypothetical protein CLUP02_15019 [Colletotrichum lupini]
MGVCGSKPVPVLSHLSGARECSKDASSTGRFYKPAKLENRAEVLSSDPSFPSALTIALLSSVCKTERIWYYTLYMQPPEAEPAVISDHALSTFTCYDILAQSGAVGLKLFWKGWWCNFLNSAPFFRVSLWNPRTAEYQWIMSTNIWAHQLTHPQIANPPYSARLKATEASNSQEQLNQRHRGWSLKVPDVWAEQKSITHDRGSTREMGGVWALIGAWQLARLQRREPPWNDLSLRSPSVIFLDPPQPSLFVLMSQGFVVRLCASEQRILGLTTSHPSTSSNLAWSFIKPDSGNQSHFLFPLPSRSSRHPKPNASPNVSKRNSQRPNPRLLSKVTFNIPFCCLSYQSVLSHRPITTIGNTTISPATIRFNSN